MIQNLLVEPADVDVEIEKPGRDSDSTTLYYGTKAESARNDSAPFSVLMGWKNLKSS